MKVDLTSESTKLAPWIFKFRIDGTDYGGEISALGDPRVEQFFRFVPADREWISKHSRDPQRPVTFQRTGGYDRRHDQGLTWW
jgi:hypothetical protein